MCCVVIGYHGERMDYVWELLVNTSEFISYAGELFSVMSYWFGLMLSVILLFFNCLF